MKIQVELTDEQFQKLWDKGAAYYMRENPRKRWTEAEKKDCVRAMIVQMAQNL